MISVRDRVVFAAMEFVEVVERAEIMCTSVTAIEHLGVAKTLHVTLQSNPLVAIATVVY